MEVDLERLREVCERYGVVRLESLAHGAARPDSDIDLLYTLAQMGDWAGRSTT